MKLRKLLAAALAGTLLCGCSGNAANTTAATTAATSADETAAQVTAETEDIVKPTLTLIGHSSMKIKTTQGTVIYIDPAYAGDYSEPADYILITHEHGDHNMTSLVTTKDTTVTYRQKNFFAEDRPEEFVCSDVTLRTVPAENSNHMRKLCVGFILEFDGIKLYHSGDTSKIDEMATLAAENIDYAFLPIDGVYNMDAAEAAECAKLIAAKHVTPIHINGVNDDYDDAKAKTFAPDGVLYIPYGDTIELEKS